MKKSEVYSWRISPELKRELEVSARENELSMAELLDRIAREWIRRQAEEENEERQRSLQAEAARSFGVLSGGDPGRSRRVQEVLREKLGSRRRRRSR